MPADLPTETPTPTATETLVPADTPTATVPPTETSVPADVPPMQPSASVAPAEGAANTPLTVSGGGFPADTTVGAGLGVVESDGDVEQMVERYATAMSDSNGNYSVTFIMPVQWPDGAAIAAGPIIIQVGADDFPGRASTQFDYLVTPVVTTQ